MSNPENKNNQGGGGNQSGGGKKQLEPSTITQDQVDSIMETVNNLKKLTEDQAKTIENQTKDIETIQKTSGDPRRRKKLPKIKKIKDDERQAKMYIVNLELTKNNEVVFFDEDRQRLINEEKIEHELLIRRLVRTRNIRKGKDETFLLGLFDCIDKDNNKFQVEMPFAAMSEWRKTIKVQLFKTSKKPDSKNEGVTTKAIRDEDGGIVEEYDIDLETTTTNYWFDVKVLTDGAFKGKVFKKVPAQDLNLF